MKEVMVSSRAAAPSLEHDGVCGGGASGDESVGLVDHRHVWVRLPGTVGLFVCREESCLWAAVCPGCLGSLDVALSAQAGIVGMELYWCPFHGGEVGA